MNVTRLLLCSSPTKIENIKKLNELLKREVGALEKMCARQAQTIAELNVKLKATHTK